MPSDKFTKRQLEAWHSYERVRVGSVWNMYETRAVIATGLTDEMFAFVMNNYGALKKRAKEEKA